MKTKINKKIHYKLGLKGEIKNNKTFKKGSRKEVKNQKNRDQIKNINI